MRCLCYFSWTVLLTELSQKLILMVISWYHFRNLQRFVYLYRIPYFSTKTYVESTQKNCHNVWGSSFEHRKTDELQHEISNKVVCGTSKASDQPAHMRSLIRAFASRLNIIWVLNYWLNIIWIPKLKRRLHRLFWVCTCENDIVEIYMLRLKCSNWWSR